MEEKTDTTQEDTLAPEEETINVNLDPTLDTPKKVNSEELTPFQQSLREAEGLPMFDSGVTEFGDQVGYLDEEEEPPVQTTQ